MPPHRPEDACAAPALEELNSGKSSASGGLCGAAAAAGAAEAGVAAARPCFAAVVAPEPEKKHRAAVWAELD